jgi:hypothetical protein
MTTKAAAAALVLWFLKVHAADSPGVGPAPPGPRLIACRKIWSEGGHNAFTDLIRFRDRWFCTCREAEGHVRGDGRIRVLVSTNSEEWTSAALLEEKGIDLRDPKLSVTADGRLMLVIGGSVYKDRRLVERQPRVALSKDGQAWTSPARVLQTNDWLWRVTWHKGRAYGISYIVPIGSEGRTGLVEWTLKLVESEDGLKYRTVANLEVPSHPNEATVRFLANDDCIALVRREGMGKDSDKSAWIGISHPPYTNWQWKSAGMQIGGPNFIVLGDGTMIASGREYRPAPGGPVTFVDRMDLGSVTPQLTLPSGGDCSYPGLVWHEGALWVSYYASHEGRTGIYLAKIGLPPP